MPEDPVERALAVAYRVLLPGIDAGNPDLARLGYSRPSYARAMARTDDFFRDVAEDVRDWWRNVRWEVERNAESDWRAVCRTHMEEAAMELVAVIAGLPRSVRDVVEMRSAGRSWREISAALPDRVYFSLLDDWRSTCRLLADRHDDIVRRLS